MNIFNRLSSLTWKLVLMMFCTIINFDILRNLKESMLLPRFGAEVIPFIKFWLVIPEAFIFLATYSFMANRLSPKRLFIFTLLPFIIWVPLFSQYLYPNLSNLALNQAADRLALITPGSLSALPELVRYWPLTLFFGVGELWGSGVIALLFWTLANDLHDSNAATDNYPLIAMLGNSASLISGPLILYCLLRENGADWQGNLDRLTLLFLFNAAVMLLIHANCQSSKHPRHVKNTTTMLSFHASIKYLTQSPQLYLLALLVLFYCISFNMIEVAWKSQLVVVYNSERDYSIFMSKMTLLNGIGCLVCGVILQHLLKKGWKPAALATPWLMLATGAPFFALVLYNQYLLNASGAISQILLQVTLLIGLINNVLSKSAKYTFFDATKEIAFVPLDNEQKYKGKAAIELVVSRVGKSGSALLQQGLIIMLGSLALSMFWLSGLFVVAIIFWIKAIYSLNQKRSD
ncbi:hypothetical protein EOPP23_00855 [Endozoicomonas sp. OPT23]|uniref:Npt1/Npt2 family nucleotide transporter n=1 Tax=Endozoicomonas sp. OPT23 TaxID=2072845 RepID=UPI00129A427C|nr:Npt1/Npt2 family nucleotide transporter [Endozoicomonas sp. OPT23]MRI31540.1 hypothetical protein [Endozoicomonas sp. OPT23]